MLKCLYIENIAVIEKADIEFNNGFNVLTGETGAGKSIIIDSINAVLGERTSKDIIRNGCDKATVTALFSDFNEEELKALSENGFSPDEDGNITVRRVITPSGSTIKLNAQPVPSAVLKDIAKYLINIHGQHDSQLLLQPELHYIYIDKIADNNKELGEYKEEFERFNRIRKQLADLETDEDEKLRKIDLLTYQISELENADIKPGEVEELKEKQKTARTLDTKLKMLGELDSMLGGGENSVGIINMLDELKDGIKKLNMDVLSSEAESTENIFYTVSALREKLSRTRNELAGGNFDINTISDRLETLNALMRKYGSSEEKMLRFLESAKKQLHDIEFADEEAERLSEELEQSEKRLIEKASVLTKTRETASRKFENDVTDVLKYLDMPQITFKVNTAQSRYRKTGCDDIEFLISANLGESPKPLSKIASGGELSRVMLAIKSVLSDKDGTGTLIFDEIDTGISGRAAGKVGRQMKKLSSGKQVICVTHLAQIAAAADSHYLIEKSTENGRTYTAVLPLIDETRIKEIARIMSGTDITENLYASAKELIDEFN